MKINNEISLKTGRQPWLVRIGAQIAVLLLGGASIAILLQFAH